MTSRADDELDLIWKAKSLIDQIRNYTWSYTREKLARSLLYVTALDKFMIPQKMVQDMRRLLVPCYSGHSGLISLCNEQLSILENAPNHAVPDSVKLLPIIYSFALWLVGSIYSLG